MTGTPHQERLRLWSTAAVQVAALWILVGALFKLLWGTPADLPAVVRDLPLPLGLTYRIAIGAELVIAAVGLLRPRWGWLPVAGLMLVFDAVLVLLMLQGAENCGCFGATVTIPPWVMLVIDTALLAAILVTRPWRLAARGPRPVGWLVALTPLLVVVPWVIEREARGADEPLAAALPQYATLEPEDWVGDPLAVTQLARWLDLSALPAEGRWVFYRATCAHCAEHLFEVIAEDDGTAPIVVIRIIDPGERPEEAVVDLLPEGPNVAHVTLPEGVDWVMTTPAEIWVEDGVVVAAHEGG
jgi:hypothetical protein